MKLDHAIELVRDAEGKLADELTALGERHAAESDVYHTAHVLAARAATQLDRLEPHARRHSAPERPHVEPTAPALERVRRFTSDILSGRPEPEPGMLLLHDLREAYLSAHGAEIAWVTLRQAAKAARDTELVAAADEGLEEAERRWKWLRTKIKDVTPQVLVAG
ncbi:MAG TPA: hypothetical protein VHR46_00400 [Gaiella sp.]|nr:hypothetical protein [Gaiella sp.]